VALLTEDFGIDEAMALKAYGVTPMFALSSWTRTHSGSACVPQAIHHVHIPPRGAVCHLVTRDDGVDVDARGNGSAAVLVVWLRT
jgi:hypothetical protein